MNQDRVQPVVLVGGKSRRFGRDKLLEPMPDGAPLLARPVAALRDVFGPRVAVVGACNPDASAIGDFVIPDPYPGAGPAGGILAALEHAGCAVFVLSGDLPAVTAGVVRTILGVCEARPGGLAWLGVTDRVQPCIGVYHADSAGAMRGALSSGAGLKHAIPESDRVLVPIDPASAVNVNRPDDLRQSS